MHSVSASMTNFAAKSCLQDTSAPQGPGLTIFTGQITNFWFVQDKKNCSKILCIVIALFVSIFQSFLSSKFVCAQQKNFMSVKPSSLKLIRGIVPVEAECY